MAVSLDDYMQSLGTSEGAAEQVRASTPVAKMVTIGTTDAIPREEEEAVAAEERSNLSQQEMDTMMREPRASMHRTSSIRSQGSIMGSVQRRIKLIEELQGDSQDRSSTLVGASESSNVSRLERPLHAMGLRGLILLLVGFAALSSGGGVLLSLEIHLAAAGGDPAQLDLVSLRATCYGVFAVSSTVSLGLGIFLGMRVTGRLRAAVKLMETLHRPTHDRDLRVMLRKSKRSRILDVSAVEAAAAHLLYSIAVFKRYLPDTVVQDIVRGEGRAMRLHVSRRNVTIMFSDLQDFTTISEALSHSNLLFLLTRYLSIMTRIVEAYEGVVAEILGDGLLVYWNTPDDVDQHAAKACAAALAMTEALESMNSEFTALGLPALFVRVGIHTGTVLTGNIGSERKMKFGCMGDPVNLASRLEGICKNYGVGVLCSEATWAELPEDGCFLARQLDLVQVKGKNEPTRIYEVMGLDISSSGSASNEGAEAEEAGTDSRAIGDARRMVSFRNVAKEAISESSEAFRSEEMAEENPFVRVLKKARRRLSRNTGGEVRSSASGTSVASRRSSQEPSAERSPDIGRQVSMTEYASSGSRGDIRARSATPHARALAERYEQALLHYQSAHFLVARDVAQALVQDAPGDRAARVLLQRITRYIGHGDQIVGLSDQELEDWTGVVVMTEK